MQFAKLTLCPVKVQSSAETNLSVFRLGYENYEIEYHHVYILKLTVTAHLFSLVQAQNKKRPLPLI